MGRLWQAAWKRTRDDGELLLLNLHRERARRIEIVEKKYGKPLKRR